MSGPSRIVPRRIASFCSFGTGGVSAKSSTARSAGVVYLCSPWIAAATDAVIRFSPLAFAQRRFSHSWLPCVGLGIVVRFCIFPPMVCAGIFNLGVLHG